MIDVIRDSDYRRLCESETYQKKYSRGMRFWRAAVYTDDLLVHVSIEQWRELPNSRMSAICASSKRAFAYIQLSDDAEIRHLIDKELTRRVKKIKAQGYTLPGESYAGPALPMLAKNYRKASAVITYPCYVQPKYDGYRVMTDGTLFWTRYGNFIADSVISHLKCATNGLILDGELLLPPPFSFEDTQNAISRMTAGETRFSESAGRDYTQDMLEYHCFDVIESDLTFADRWKLISELKYQSLISTRLAETRLVNSHEQAMRLYERFLADDYEGIMFRNANGRYLAERSADLQKYKPYDDAEFTVVKIGIEHGRTVVTCKTARGLKFKCPIKGRLNLKTGGLLTVRYQKLTSNGIPRFPRGIAFKLDRQMGLCNEQTNSEC